MAYNNYRWRRGHQHSEGSNLSWSGIRRSDRWPNYNMALSRSRTQVLGYQQRIHQEYVSYWLSIGGKTQQDSKIRILRSDALKCRV
jgi:hypothetical protein